MNNRKSPSKQNRMKNSHPIPVQNPKNCKSYYSQTTSPTAMSASSLPAVPLFYSTIYADPPECSLLPKPPESWYLKSNDENLSVENHQQDKEMPKEKSYRKKSHRFHWRKNHEKFPMSYVAVKA